MSATEGGLAGATAGGSEAWQAKKQPILSIPLFRSKGRASYQESELLVQTVLFASYVSMFLSVVVRLTVLLVLFQAFGD